MSGTIGVGSASPVIDAIKDTMAIVRVFRDYAGDTDGSFGFRHWTFCISTMWPIRSGFRYCLWENTWGLAASRSSQPPRLGNPMEMHLPGRQEDRRQILYHLHPLSAAKECLARRRVELTSSCYRENEAAGEPPCFCRGERKIASGASE